jgi:phosphatidylglycerophosphate synthase
MGIGRFTAWFFSTARDTLARGLIQLHVTPNMLTCFGTLLTMAAAGFLAAAIHACGGASSNFPWWSQSHRFFSIAAALLFGSAACDMIDGAVARIGNLASEFGGFLDSTLDRISDFSIWAGLAIGYAILEKPNLTFILLCMTANLNAFLISYAKCRAEDFIEDCSIGFWKRGERIAAVLISAISCNPASMILLLSLTAPFTWLRRIAFARRALAGQNPTTDPRRGGSWFEIIQPWCYPRMSLFCDLATIGNILVIIFLRFDVSDWDLLRQWFSL